MSRAKTIGDFIPERRERRLVQAKVDHDLFEKFHSVQKKHKVKFVDFVEASMKKFIDENSAT